MKIETFEISRHDGKSENWHSLRLLKTHIDNLNTIGSTGHLLNKKTTLQEYFDTQISTPKKIEHKILEISKGNVSGNDKYLVIRCSI